MQQQIQAWVSACVSCLRCEWQKYFGAVKTFGFGQYGIAQWGQWKDQFSGAIQRAPKQWVLVLVILMLLGVLVAISRISSETEAATADGLMLEENSVLCIGVVRYSNGMQDAFFQRPDESVEETLMAQSNAELVAQGYTVEHRDCYASWQAAADFLTDGRVTLPDNATEQDFTAALMGWKQQQMMGGQ